MSTSHPNLMLIFASFNGVATHFTLFGHGEWDIQAPKIVLSYLTSFFGGIDLDTVAQAKYVDFHAPHLWFIRGVGCHILGVYGATLLHRAFFHRMSSFPGLSSRDCLISM